MQALRTTSHTRTTGKQLTYAIKVFDNKYEIWLGDKLLKQSVRSLTIGNVDPVEADVVFAVSDIENLVSMGEE